jgi:hypothetical protein
MRKIYSRPLLDHLAVEQFLSGCLNISKQYTCRTAQIFSLIDIIKLIRNAEVEVGTTNSDPTFSSPRNRVAEYRENDVRQNLRERILSELIELDQLDDDEEIKLGSGGAKPKSIDPIADSKAYFIIGLPASGKSTLVTKTAEKLGAIVLDSDFAKRKLPEYDGTPAGANIVHKESSSIVWGGYDDEPSLFGYCKTNKLNVIIPTVGQDLHDLNTKCDLFLTAGYEVHLTAVTLPREAATTRALERFLTTGRYVPLSLIFDAYANDPILNYYKLRTEATNSRKTTPKWTSFGAISTKTTPALLEDNNGSGNPVNFIEVLK